MSVRHLSKRVVSAACVLSLVAPASHAAITTSGLVDPPGLGPGDTTTSFVDVGLTAFGTLGIDGGSRLATNNMRLATGADGNASVSLTGAGSLVDITRAAARTGDVALLRIGGGAASTASFDILSGGLLRVDGSSAPGNFSIVAVATSGSASTSASLRVDGSGSRLHFAGGVGGINVGTEASSGDFSVTGGALVDGVPGTGMPFLTVGRGGGRGRATIAGEDASGNRSTLRLQGSQTGSTVGAQLAVGVRGSTASGGDGAVSVLGGGRIDIDTRHQVLTSGQPGLFIGSSDGSTGSLTVSGRGSFSGIGSSISVLGSEGITPSAGIGRNGGTGTLLVADGGRIFMSSDHASSSGLLTDRLFFDIGARTTTGATASVGTATITGTGSQLVLGGLSDTVIRVGAREFANGTLNVRDGGHVAAEALSVGDAGGTGRLEMSRGTVAVSGMQDAGPGAGFGAVFNVGRAGGVGSASIGDASRVVIASTAPFGGMNIGGTGVGPGGVGSAVVSGGSAVEASGPNTRVHVGRLGTATSFAVGTLVVADPGSSVSAGGSDGRFIVGAGSFASGSVAVGSGASISASAVIGIAHDGSADTGGTGLVCVDGSAAAPLVRVGSAGTLCGSGTVSGAVVSSGLVSPGHSPGRLTVDGSFDSRGGRILLEVERRGSGWAVDELVFTDALAVLLGDAGIEFSFLGDSDPRAFRDDGLFDVGSFLKTLDSAGNVVPFPPSLFGVFDDVVFTARSDSYTFTRFSFVPGVGATFDVAGVPLPGSGWLAAIALLALATPRAARRSAFMRPACTGTAR